MSQIPPSYRQPKSHKIKIPRTAASYTPATMDMDLRSELNVQIISGGHDKKIQEHLLYTLNAHPSNWPTQVQNRALALLRSGEAKTFPQLLKQVLDEVRKETGVLRPSAPGTATNGDHHRNGGSSGNHNNQTNGGSSSSSNGNGNKKAGPANGSTGAGGSSSHHHHSLPGPGEASNLHAAAATSLALPQVAIDEALRVTREVLTQIADFQGEEENGSA